MVVAAAALGGCGGGGARHDAAPAIDASVDAAMAACDPRPGERIELVPVATGLDRPVGVTGPVGDRRIVVVEQGGLLRLIDDAGLAEAPYLDLRAAVIAEGERGLLGLAFHPRFGANGRLFVNFTRAPDGATVIAELTADPAATTVDAATRRDLLVIEQPFPQHNGGGLEFGPDGYLYVATGDGGSGGDPFGNGQRLTTHLGKVLRLDVDGVDGARPYRIPSRQSLRDQPRRPRRSATRDLALGPAQPVAIHVRSRDRRSVPGRCRPGPLRRDRLHAAPTGRELGLG
jgi:glucose/arabinose dehydrogenase